MQLDPKHLTLNNLLMGRLFRIPEYQRAYSWGSRQRQDLFDDINEVRRTGQDHFMATMVCLARDKRQIHADEYQAVEIVDGQQRLTTLVILLKAIEKSLSSDDVVEAAIRKQISDLLVKGDDYSLVLLQTNHDSSSVFVDYLRKGAIKDPSTVDTDAERNLVDAAMECEAFIVAWKAQASLVELVALVRNRLSLIYHQLTDEASVYRIFEVLNSRGLDVRWIDKLKSQLMALIFANSETGARSDAIAEMKTKWEEIYRTLGLRSDLGDEALRFSGTWRKVSRPNRILSQEDAASTLTAAAGTSLASIAGEADWLRKVVSAVHSLDANVRLRAVTRIVHARFLATAIILRDFSPDIQKQLLSEWERVTFRVFGLGGADTRFKVGDYIRLGYEIIVNKLDEKIVSQRIADLGEGFSIDEVLAKAKWSQSYEGWTEELRYLLFRYDEYLTTQSGGKFNDTEWNKIWTVDPSRSIEHILPQSSGHTLIHHLGNLTMLPPGVNSMLQDSPPSAKSKTYKDCGLRGTVEVAGVVDRANGVWDTKQITDRATALQAFIRSEWA